MLGKLWLLQRTSVHKFISLDSVLELKFNHFAVGIKSFKSHSSFFKREQINAPNVACFELVKSCFW